MNSPRSLPGQPPPNFVVRSIEDLVAMVPLVLGFHPQDSITMLTCGSAARPLHARVDLGTSVSEQAQVAATLSEAARANQVSRTALVVHSSDPWAAEGQALLVLEALLEAGIEVIAVIRADGEQWYAMPECGAGGTAYDVSKHRFMAQSVFDGRVVHRDRAEVAAGLHGGDDAERRVLAGTAAAVVHRLMSGRSTPRSEGRWLQQHLREAVEGEVTSTLADMARVLGLCSVPVLRDVAWAEISRENAGQQVDLWRDLVRRSPVELMAPGAALLAFAAWQDGDGALAWCAVDRALSADPDYSLAHLVAQVLEGAVSPEVWSPIPPSTLVALVDDDGHTLRDVDDDARSMPV